jgi:hypothetical protein
MKNVMDAKRVESNLLPEPCSSSLEEEDVLEDETQNPLVWHRSRETG